MARGNSNFTLYTQVQFDNGQAIKATKELRNVLKGLTQDQKDAKKLLDDMRNGSVAATNAQIKAQEKVVAALNARVRAQKLAVQTSAQDLSMLRRAVTDLDKMSLRQLNMAMKEAEKKMNSLGGSKRSQKELQATREIMDLIQTRITGIKSGFKDLWAAATNGTKMSATEMQNLIRVIEQNGTTLAKNKQHYQQMLNVVQQMRIKLANFKGFSIVDDAFAKGKASNVLTPKLQEYIKFYQGIATSSQSSAKQIEDANRKIAQAQTELTKRISVALKEYDGNALVKKVNEGLFRGTIAETKQAISGLEKFKESLRTTNPAAIQPVDEAINKLKIDLEQTSRQAMLAKDYLANMKTGGTFKGTIADLEKVRQGLVFMRSNLVKAGDAKGIRDVDAAIVKVDNDIRTAGIDAGRLHQIISNPKSVYSLKELEAAYEKLKNEISQAGVSQAEFTKKAAQIKNIRTQIEKLNGAMGQQRSILLGLGTQIKNIVLHYIGLQMMVMRIIDAFKGVFKLSDQMANVQKVTGATANEVNRLVDELQAIDSRTSTEKLMEFAEQAGKLGIYTTQGVEGMRQFAEQAERINATLGEEAGGAQAVADLVKLNNILHTTSTVMERTGNESNALKVALDATGSAILNVGNNSAASYGPIVDYVTRLGAIGSTAHMSVQELIALAGTLDALGMPAEAGSTALSQFIAALQRRTDAMAKAADVAVTDLRRLVNTDMMGAIQLMIKQIQNGRASAQDLMDAMSGRSKSNVNIRNVLNLLAGNAEMLGKQLNYAKQGFDSAFSNQIVGNMQLVSAALREFYGEDVDVFRTLKELESTFANIGRGLLTSNVFGTKTWDELTEKIAKLYGYDAPMLSRAFHNVLDTMVAMKNEGKLSEQSFYALGASTNTASIMEMEFARVNENAAGQAARLGNAIREWFVNSDTVEFFTDLTGKIMDWGEALMRGETWARVLAGALTTLGVAVGAVRMEFTLWMETHVISTVKGWVVAIQANVKQLGLWRAGIMSVRLALVNLKTFLKTFWANNWFGLIAAGIAGIAVWLKSAANETSRWAKATTEAQKAMNDEVRVAASLFSQVQKLNIANEERSALINQINNKYGALLGYMLDEKATAYELANAYSLVVAKIKEKAQAQMESKLIEQASEQSADKIAAAGTKLSKAADTSTGDARKGAELQTEITAKIYEEIARNAGQSVEQILAKVTRSVIEPYMKNNPLKERGDLDAAIKKLIEALKEDAQNMERVSRYVAGVNMANQKQSNTARQKVINEVVKLENTLLGGKAKNNPANLSDDDLTLLITRLKAILDDPAYKTAAKGNKVMEQNLKTFAKNLQGLQAEVNRRNNITPWGNPMPGKDMSEWSTETLAKYHKKLEEAAAAAAKGADVSKVFPDLADLLVGKTLQEIQKVLDEEDEKVQEILKSRHMTANGTFHHPTESNRSKTEKEMMDEARKHLEEYYKHREEVATNALNRGEVMESEYNRFILANQQELLTNQAILEEKFIDSKKKFTTEAVNEWMKSITGVDGVVMNINYDKIEAFLADKGKHLVGTIQFNAEKYRASLQASIKKNREEIEKILLEDRPIAKLAEAFLNDLNRLNLLFTEWNGAELMTTEEAQQKTASRLQFLMDEAKKGYALTMEDFIEDMKKANKGEFAPWAEALLGDKDQLQALLMLVQGFMEQYEEAVRKMENNMRKRFEQQLKTVGADGTSFNSRVENVKRADRDDAAFISRRQGTQAQADSWGFTGYNLAGVGDSDKYKIDSLNQQAQAELNLYNVELARLELMKKTHEEEISLLEERAKNTQDEAMKAELLQEIAAKKQAAINEEKAQADVLAESWRNVEQAQNEATQGYLDTLTNAINQAVPFYENLEQFAKDFGANIFGSKEDRQEAARDLMRNLIQTTGKMLTQWLVYISTKKIYDKMEVAMETMKQQQLLAIKLKAQAEMLAAEGNTALADATMKEAGMAVDAAAAAGKEASKGGWIGWALGAALSLAMTLAMSLAMSKLKKAIPNSASAGKLTTSMLTYGEGRYPEEGTRQNVMGTDGRRYNAVVKPNLTTGEYNRPHLGIVGEKGAELIVDHPTYMRLKEQEPWVLRAIYNTKRFGSSMMNYRAINEAAEEMRMADVRRFRTHAAGTVDALEGYGADGTTVGNGGGQDQMMQTIAMLTEAVNGLREEGVRGHFDRRELVDTYDEEKREMRRMGV